MRPHRRRWPAALRPRSTTVLLVLAAILGTAATACLAAAGTTLGQNPAATRPWYFAGAAFLTSRRLGTGNAVALTDVALAVWALAWGLAALALRRGARFGALLAAGISWSLPLLVGPPLFSPDVYSYAAIGASVHHGVDPFVHGPGVLGQLPAVRGAEVFWRNTPTPYSPPFVALLAAVSWLFQEHLLPVVVALRALELAAWTALVLLVRSMATRRGGEARWALWLGPLAPLVLVSSLSAAHNDLLMTAFLVAGLALALRGRPLIGVLLCALAAEVKADALVGIAVIAVHAAAQRIGPRLRLRALIGTGALGCAAFAAGVQVSGWGWRWVGNLSVPGNAVQPLSPTTALAAVIDPGVPPLDAVRTGGTVLAGVLCVLLLTRVSRWGPVRVTAWMLVAILALGPVFWPWYLVAPALLLAVAGTRGERLVTGVLSVALLFVLLPGGGPPVLSMAPQPLIDWAVLGVLGALLLGCLVVVWRGRRRRGWDENWVAGPDAAALAGEPRVLVVTPTFDEAANVTSHVEAVLARRVRPEILIVDDSSPDGTAGLVRQVAAAHPGRVHLLERADRRGLGSAYVAGFRWALEQARWDVVVQMDVDGSHEPRSVDDLVVRATGADLVLGSRYVPGGRVMDWPLRRRALSWLGNQYARLVTGVPVRDLTGGFKAWQTVLLARLDLDSLLTEGYGFQIETTVQAAELGADIVEVPIDFRDRVRGRSKMRAGIAGEALVALWRTRGHAAGARDAEVLASGGERRLPALHRVRGRRDPDR